jgi:pyrimidine nucleoside transport protein
MLQIQWHPVLSGLVIQFLLGLVTIRWSVGRSIFQCIGDRVTIFLGYSNVGARFVYGSDLIDKGIFAFQVCIFCFHIGNIGYFVDSLTLYMLQFGF